MYHGGRCFETRSEWLDTEDVSQLWEIDATLPRFRCKMDSEDGFYRSSRSLASEEADRMQRLSDEWSYNDYDLDD